MSRDFSKKPQQKFNIKDSEIEDTQIVGQGGEDITSIQNKCSGNNNTNNLTIITAQIPKNRQEYRSRQNLLKKVKEFWIEGVLEQSLHKQIPMILDLEERSDAVAKFRNGEIRINRNEKATPLNRGTKIIDIFDGKNIKKRRQILILGEPGSGKTITLLELAKEWIDRAKNDARLSIPVIVNLSSYKDKNQQNKKEEKDEKDKIIDWLVEELNTYYQVSSKDARNLIKQKKLLFLFDGLDEIDDKYRVKCIEALNDFIDMDSEIIICCRIKDYQALPDRLKLETAIYLKPLTFEQIYSHLDRLGYKLRGLKTLLRRYLSFQELAKTPLILSIMIVAHEGVRSEDLLKKYWLKEKKKQLFDDYIKRMFDRRCWEHKPPPYEQKQLVSFLTFIAKGMEKESQSIFLIERIQPSYLNEEELFIYKIAVSSFLFLVTFLIGYGMENNIISGIIFGIIGILLGILSKQIKPIVKLEWDWKQAVNKIGLPILLPFFIVGFLIGLMAGIIANKTWIFSLIIGLFVGIFFCIFLVISYSLSFTGSLYKYNSQESEKTIQPNEGIWKSGKNGIIIIRVFFILMSILIFFLVSFQVRKFDLIWIASGLKMVLSWGVLLALINGSALAVIQHLFLRLIIGFKYKIPRNYTKLLEYATERIFMQKVGGGYIFIHRMLREHFAQIKSVDRIFK